MSVFATVAFVMAADRARAQDLRTMTTAEAAQSAARIVLAKTLSTEAREVKGSVYTFTKFSTIEVVKGHVADRFTVRLLGGQAGGIVIDAPFMPQFVPGEEVVLFLGRDNSEGFATIFPQGIFRVRTEPGTSTKIVTPNPNGLPLWRAHDQKAYPPKSAPPFPRLDDFLLSLRRLK